MEFDKPSTKYMFFAMVFIAVIGIGAMFTEIYRMESREFKRRAQYREDCKKLDARYGQTYQIKDGPYRDVEMLAVGFGEETVVLVTKYGNDETERRFRCGDVFQPKKFRVEPETER